jgi:hypothetical protein
MLEWYRRLAELPGLRYDGSSGVDRRRLRGRNAVPQVQKFRDFEDRPSESLWWPASDGKGGGSASPAQQHGMDPQQDAPVSAVLRRVYETLELPGEPSDYHFALMGAYERLWARRREAAGLLEEVEKLCLLDVRLIEARPDIVTDERGGKTMFLRVPAFGRLIFMYEREGFLREALEVAELASRFDQEQQRLTDMHVRLARLEGEGVLD